MNKPLKVAHLVNNVGPAGKEVGIVKIMRHFDPQRVESSLVVLNEVHRHGGMNYDGLDLIHLKIPKGNSIKVPLQLRDLFRERKFDIIHTHSWGTLLEGILGARFAGVPVVIHGEHGTFPQKPLHLFIQNFFWRWADQVLSVSDELRKKLADRTGFPAKRIKVILNGVDEKRFFRDRRLRSEFRSEMGFAEKDFVIGTVGRITQVKNHPMLIRAFGRNHVYLKGGRLMARKKALLVIDMLKDFVEEGAALEVPATRDIIHGR